MRRTLETSSSGTQTPHTKCQFAAKLSALSRWFIEPGPLFTILSSSGGISIACAMGRYLFKSFSGFKKKKVGGGEKKGSQPVLQSASFQQGHCEDPWKKGPLFFFPPFLKRDAHQINSHELASGCFQKLLFKNSLIIPPTPRERYRNLSNYEVVNLNDDTLLVMPFKESKKWCGTGFLSGISLEDVVSSKVVLTALKLL